MIQFTALAVVASASFAEPADPEYAVALERLSIEGDVTFFDEFDDGRVDVPPTSDLIFDAVAEADGGLLLQASDGFTTTSRFGSDIQEDNVFLSPLLHVDGISALIRATFRPSELKCGQFFGIGVINATAVPTESTALFVANFGGDRAVVFFNDSNGAVVGRDTLGSTQLNTIELLLYVFPSLNAVHPQYRRAVTFIPVQLWDFYGGDTTAFTRGPLARIFVQAGTNLDVFCGEPPTPPPVLVVPGVMGSELRRADNDADVWLDVSTAFSRLRNGLLFQMLLDRDGSPDDQRRCNLDGQPCDSSADCLLSESLCLEGGQELVPGDLLSLDLPLVPFAPYDDLISRLDAGPNYDAGQNLFACPYDWRRSNVESAARLEGCINQVRELTGAPTVDVVAHSMGGLVTRQYIKTQSIPPVRRLIYLATPHDGAPVIFNALAHEDGLHEHFLTGKLAFLFPEHQVVALAAKTFPAIYELLPRSRFVVDFRAGKPRTLPLAETYGSEFISTGFVGDANTFHTGIRDDLAIYRVDQHSVIGSGQPTLGALSLELSPDGENRWCAATVTGDRRVPVRSARETTPKEVNEVYLDLAAIDRDHGNLPGSTLVAEVVERLLLGLDTAGLPNVASAPFPRKGTILEWCTGSPVDIAIVDSLGNRNGVVNGDRLLEISDSSMHFFEHNQSGTLAADGSYTFEITGETAGEFSLSITQLREDGHRPREVEFKSIPVTPTSAAVLQVTPSIPNAEMLVDMDGDGSFESAVSPSVTNTSAGDLDRDGDVDEDDVDILLAWRGMAADPTGDERDLDGDGFVTGIDARQLTILCTRPRCATESPPSCGLGFEVAIFLVLIGCISRWRSRLSTALGFGV